MKGRGERTGWRTALAGVMVLALLSLPVGAGAEPRYWIGGGVWSDDTSWSPSGVPQAGDDVYLQREDSTFAIIVLDRSYTGLEGALGWLGVGTNNLNGASVFINFRQSGEELWASGITVGAVEKARGLFTQTGNLVKVTGDLILGNVAESTGTFEFLDVATLATGNTFVGNEGAGEFNHWFGKHYVGVNPDLTVQDGLHELIVGRFGGSTGTYNLGTTGELYSARTIVGDAGSLGTFDQSGDSVHVVMNDLIIGQDPGTTGTYNLKESATLTVGGNLYLGDMGGTGVFTQSFGTNTVAGSLVIGDLSEGGDPSVLKSNGTYTLSDGALTVQGNAIVGMFGTGTFQQYGGTHTVGGDLNLAQAWTAQGTYTLHGGTLTVEGSLNIGHDGVGVFEQGGGTNTVSLNLVLGNNPTGEGRYYLKGGDLTSRYARIGLGGFGRFDHTNGTYTVGGEETWGEFVLGGMASVTGVYNLGLPSPLVQGAKGPVGAFGGPELTVYGTSVIGDSGIGDFTQYEGIHSVKRVITGYDEFDIPSYGGGDLVLGAQPTGVGSYTMKGGSLLVEGALTVGERGSGTFTQDGGDVSVDGFIGVGGTAGGSGSYFLNDGTLTMWGNEVKIGGSGTGYFFQTGGYFSYPGAMYLGDHVGGIGIYGMTGGTLEGGGLALGEWGGRGYFSQSGGGVSVTGLQLARQVDVKVEGGTVIQTRSYGEYNLSGDGTLTVNGFAVIGRVGDGLFNQTGGVHTVSYDLILGQSDYTVYDLPEGGKEVTYHQGAGTYTLNAEPRDGYRLWVAGNLVVGDSGTGYFHHQMGNVKVGGDLVLGTNRTHEPDGFAPYTMTGQGTYRLFGDPATSTLETAFTIVGREGKGTFEQYGGTHSVGVDLNLGQAGGSQGTYGMSNGLLTTGRNLNVGVDGKGTFVQTGGEVRVGGGLIVATNATASGSSYTLTNGDLSSGWLHVGVKGEGKFSQAGGTNTTGNLIVSVYPEGKGTYELLGGTLNAGVIENNGTFRVDADASTLAYDFFKGTGTVEVVAGVFDNKATMSPGNSPGTLTILGDFANMGTLLFELEGYVKGSEYDFLYVTGDATLDGWLRVDLLKHFDPTAGSVFNILHADGDIFGTFSNYQLPGLTGGRYFEVAYNYDTDDVFLYVKQQTSVPEPGTLLLLGAGLLGLGAARRRFAGRD